MSIKQRGQSFQATVHYKGARYRRQFPTRLEAERWLVETKTALSQGRSPEMAPSVALNSDDYRPSTFKELAEYVFEHHWRGTRSEKTMKINVNHMIEWIGPEKDYRKITDHTTDMLVAQLRDTYPDSTVNKKMSTLRVILRLAYKRGWTDRMVNIKHFKESEGRIRVFSPEEERKMLDWFIGAGDMDMHDYTVVSIDCGFRQSEVLKLLAHDVDHRKASVYDTKNRKRRAVPLTPRARDVLERRKRLHDRELFPMTKDQINWHWNKMRSALGYADDEEFVPHTMRHTFCSRLADLDVSAQVIQALAGHTRIETTMRYIHLSERSLFSAIERLAASMGASETSKGGDATPHPATPHATTPRHMALCGA
jgi:integrase